MAEDKRIRHTKARILEAMIQCLQDTAPEHITVKRICEQADINRSTFYTYYTDPLALYDIIEQDAIEGFRHMLEKLRQKEVDYPDFLKQVITYIGENDRIFLALIHTNQSRVKAINIELLQKSDLNAIASGQNIHPYELEFYVGGMLSMITCWLENGKKEEPEEIAAILFRMLHGGHAWPA